MSMSFDELGKKIAAMTPAERAMPALVGDDNTGEAGTVTELIPIEDWNGDETPNQNVLMTDI